MMLARRSVLPRLSAASRLQWQRSLTAATSKQKRALNPDQIHGSSTPGAPTSPAPTPTSTPLPGATPSRPTTSSSSSNWVPVGIAGAAVLGGVAYYSMGTTPPNASPPETARVTPGESKEDSPSETGGGNRVTSIAIPPRMRNVSTSATAVPAATVHPADGHRVSSLTPASSRPSPPPDALVDPSMTQRAMRQLAPPQQQSPTDPAHESLVQSHQSLWTSLEHNYLADLETLAPAQLKTRIVQLASELKDRTKWEAVRLKEFLAMKDKETAQHYRELMQQQRMELENVLAQRLRDQEHALQLKANAAIQEKELAIQNLLATALDAQRKEMEEDVKAQEDVTKLQITSQVQDEFHQKLEAYKKQVAQELEQKVAALEALTQKMQKLEAALQASGTFQKTSIQAHRLSAAALALAERLESKQPVTAELATLRSVAGEEGVIPTALQTIPVSAAQSGIPTVAELQAEFDRVYDKCRQASLVPKGRLGVDGQLAGMLFAKLKYPPGPDDPAPESASDPNDKAEYLLVRAKKHVGLGQLEQAVEQLEQLSGQVEFTARDWKQQALDRIAVDKALRVIKMECALLNESMVE